MEKNRKLSRTFEFLVACTPGIVDNTLQIYPCDRRLLQLAEWYKEHMEMNPEFFTGEDVMACDGAYNALVGFFNCDESEYWDKYGTLEKENNEQIYMKYLPSDTTTDIQISCAIDIWNDRFWHLNQFQVHFKAIEGVPEEELYRHLLSQPRLPDIVLQATSCLKNIANKYASRITDKGILTLSHLLVQCYRGDFECCQQKRIPTAIKILISKFDLALPGSQETQNPSSLDKLESKIEELCFVNGPSLAKQLQDYIDLIYSDYQNESTLPVEYRCTRRNGFANNPRSFIVWELFEIIYLVIIKYDARFKHNRTVATAVPKNKPGRKGMPFAAIKRIAKGIFEDRNKNIKKKNISVKEFCRKYDCTQNQYDAIQKKIRKGIITQDGDEIIIKDSSE